jgi:hypothetical protein
MIGLSPGVAHVSYKGGGLCLPARSPYDRQVLSEQVVHCLRTRGPVQVLINDGRWLVHAPTPGPRIDCAGCGQRVDTAWYASASGDQPFCGKCALTEVPRRHSPGGTPPRYSSVG